MRISDWSSDVVLFRSGVALAGRGLLSGARAQGLATHWLRRRRRQANWRKRGTGLKTPRVALIREDGSWPDASARAIRSEEHTSELQSLMRISYAVFCLKKKKYTCESKPHVTSNN